MKTPRVADLKAMMDEVEWKPVEIPSDLDPGGLPYATHEGKLNLGGCILDVVQLSTGQRAITAESVARFLDYWRRNICS